MIKEYFWVLAQKAAEKANGYEGGGNILPAWIYCQWAHETADFTSELMESNHNLGGLCQTQPNDTPQPDGDQYYKQFESYAAYAEYFGWYLSQYREDGIYDAKTLEDYVAALKHGQYFGDSLENYLTGCYAVYADNFV